MDRARVSRLLRAHPRHSDAADEVERLLDDVGLDGRFRGKLIGTYSTGMKRRVEIARALMGRPKVLFLDEPTRGLDLPAKREMWTLLRTLAATEQVTTFLSSHDAQEIRSLCSEISVIASGRVVYTGATARSRRRSRRVRREARSVADGPLTVRRARPAEARLREGGRDRAARIFRRARLSPYATSGSRRSMARILIVDDDAAIRRMLVRGLTTATLEIDEVSNGTTAIARLDDRQYEIVLTDLRMTGADGMDVLRKALTVQPTPAVIIMSGHGTIDVAVDAIKIGAFDFVTKPFAIEQIRLRIEHALEFRRLKYQVDYLNRTQPDIYSFDRIVGANGALQRALGMVRKVARSNATILIQRRNRNGQGTGRGGRPPQLGPGRPRLREGELRGAPREPARV